jgi:hypothetical protein
MFRQVGEVFHVKHCVMDFTIANQGAATTLRRLIDVD